MQYMMAPLDSHYDRGLGATGEAFMRAAMVVRDHDKNSLFLESLPQGFLLRHAIELFLKSGIVIIHRKLKLPFNDQSPTSDPMVHIGNEWKPFNRVHSIADLYAYWKELVAAHEQELIAVSKNRPDMSLAPELDGWITLIEQTDPDGTYYRYPAIRDPNEDKDKSPFKEKTQETLFPKKPSDKKVFALVVENEDREFLKAYSFDDEAGKATLDALLFVGDYLFNFHAMTRFEFTDGW